LLASAKRVVIESIRRNSGAGNEWNRPKPITR
jgi:hypothetical protein